ncbi:MAG: hypothetical protein IKX78_00775, partial [Clostridia bacterium]|nr:hypothetical protein [Clostridia bacterium]
VFVICHKPIESLGDSAGKIESILRECSATAKAPVIFVSGHWHEIGENTFSMPCENLVYLNLPSLQYTDGGGLGFIAGIKKGEVVLTGMNFLTNETLEDYTYHIEYGAADE